MRTDAAGVTNPAAGVMATRPATAPTAAPRTDGVPRWSHLIVTQVMAAMAAAVLVVTKAVAAMPLAPSADPALKPNHPNHRSAAPRTVIGTSCGSVAGSISPVRATMNSAATSAAIPLDRGTTVPPAKSSTPKPNSQPSGDHTQWAIGAYTNVDHATANRTNALKRLRSAKAPVMSAGVMIANIIWKAMNARWGIVVAYTSDGSPVTPSSASQSSPPMIPSPVSGPKASV